MRPDCGIAGCEVRLLTRGRKAQLAPRAGEFFADSGIGESLRTACHSWFACGSAATTRLGSVLSYRTGSMIVSIDAGSTPWTLRPKEASAVRDARSESVVRDVVRVSAIPYSLV